MKESFFYIKIKKELLIANFGHRLTILFKFWKIKKEISYLYK
jgi:hypothetical protein